MIAKIPRKAISCDHARAYPELSAALGGASAVPDLRGLFLRGYGSQAYAQNNGSTVGVTSTTHSSGALGSVQGDAIREVSGRFKGEAGFFEFSGAFSPAEYTGYDDGSTPMTRRGGAYFNASRVTPTADEIRPVNTAVRYLIRALP
jgi:hypothetical protein